MINLNTNLSSLIAQSSMKTSTSKLNQAIERMSTGYKINHAKDNAANYSISTNMTTQLNAYEVASDNVAMGMDLVSTASDIISMMQDRASRLQALSTQARNGTYGAQSLNAIQTEANSIISEITRLYTTAEYNGISLFNRQEYTIAPHLPQAGESGFIDETSVSGADPPPTAKAEYGGFIADPKSYEDSYVDGLPSVLAVVNSTGLEANKEYKVANKDDLSALATFVNNGGDTTNMTFILANDIDLASIDNWTPIGDYSTNTSYRFKGTFDGNGHVIKNLKINRPDKAYQGLFGVAGVGVIKNVNIKYASVTAYNVCAILVADSSSEIYNCCVEGDIFSGGNLAGGLVGQAYATINNCYSNGSIISQGGNIGGLIGQTFNSSNVISSFSDVNVIGHGEQVGGLIGYSTCAVTNCYATGNVTGQSNYVGGLIGASSSAVTNSYATGDVTGKSAYVGGLIGHSSGSGGITNCYATGDVFGEANSIGGLIGCSRGGSVLNCYALGNVIGKRKNVGGLIGDSNSTLNVINCYATGDVSGNNFTGGLIGECGSIVDNCYATGNVKSINLVGGLLGHTYRSIYNSYAMGNVSGSNSGSLVGKIHSPTADKQIENCVAYGDSNSGYFIGVICNSADGVNFSNISITNCQAMPSEKEAIGIVTKYDGADVTLPDYDKSAWLAGISEVETVDISTGLQVGINGDDSSGIRFNTNFDYNMMMLDITSDKSFDTISEFINMLSEKETELGAVANRLESALSSIEVNINNLTSSRSTLRDADLAEESSRYIQQQILQQAAATLLATANQSPAIALQLI